MQLDPVMHAQELALCKQLYAIELLHQGRCFLCALYGFLCNKAGFATGVKKGTMLSVISLQPTMSLVVLLCTAFSGYKRSRN
jgi:hypothetical protein